MKLKIYPSHKAAAKGAAEFVAQLLKKKPESSLGLEADKLLVPFYDELVQMSRDKVAPFSKFRSFQVCEYLGMPGTHPMSHRFFLVDNFLDHVPAARRFQKRLPGLPVNIKATCENFEERIKRAGGIDVIILAVGEFNWLAFNESGTPFSSITREVVLSDELRDYYSSEFPRGSAPRRGITMGIKTILDAKHIIILSAGSSCARSLSLMFKSKISTEIPITALRKHDSVEVYADSAAAELLPVSIRRAS